MEDDKATTGSSTYHINKLTETNYRSWSQQLRWILDERDLLEIVEGTEQKPTPPEEPASASEGTATATSGSIAEARETYQESLAAWTKKSKKARTIIGSSISASIMIYIEGINNPAEMWKTLQEKYSPKTQTTLLQTFREFIETKMMKCSKQWNSTYKSWNDLKDGMKNMEKLCQRRFTREHY